MTYRDPSAGRAPLSALFLRASVASLDPLHGPFIVPYLEAKKVQGALTYAPQAQGEQPLAVVDDSITGSAKAGIFVTDRAVYFSGSKARVPLEAIVEPPVFPKEPGRPAVLNTSMGALPFESTMDEVKRSMCNTLRAIAFFNRGASRFHYGHVPFSGPVGELAMRMLVHPSLPMVPTVPIRAAHAASNVARTWLDYDDGEELLCFLDESGGGHGDRFFALSDRRILARWEEHPVDVSYSSITGVTLKTGILSHTLTVNTGVGPHKIETIAPSAVARLIADFLLQIMTIAPEQRRAWAGAGPSAEDPSGAAAVMQAFPWPDVRVASLLELVHSATASGAMPVESAKDMVSRVARLQRTLRGAHGTTQGWSRTPLTAGDFELLLTSVFGPPVRQAMIDARTGMLEYDMQRAGSAAGTIASNVVGIALLAVVGVGWISTGGSSTQTVQVRIMDAPSGAGFVLLDSAGNPLARDNAKLAGGLLESLAMLSAQTLMRRALLGWNHSPQALVAEPLASLDARARAIVSHIDLAPFVSG